MFIFNVHNGNNSVNRKDESSMGIKKRIISGITALAATASMASVAGAISASASGLNIKSTDTTSSSINFDWDDYKPTSTKKRTYYSSTYAVSIQGLYGDNTKIETVTTSSNYTFAKGKAGHTYFIAVTPLTHYKNANGTFGNGNGSTSFFTVTTRSDAAEAELQIEARCWAAKKLANIGNYESGLYQTAFHIEGDVSYCDFNITADMSRFMPYSSDSSFYNLINCSGKSYYNHLELQTAAKPLGYLGTVTIHGKDGSTSTRKLYAPTEYCYFW